MTTATAMPDSVCPECGYAIDAATSLEGKRPKPGDVSVCLNCGAANVFTQSFAIRKATAEEERHFGLDVAQDRAR